MSKSLSSSGVPVLSGELVVWIRTGVEAGSHPVRVARKFGVGQELFESWLAVGRSGVSADSGVDVGLCRRLVDEVELAEVACEERWLGNAKEALGAGQPGSRATGWLNLLRARFPERWGAAAGGVKVEQEPLDARLRRLAERRGAGAS